MYYVTNTWILSWAILLLLSSTQYYYSSHVLGETIKTSVFLSPKFEQAPGEASNKYFYNVEFPKGHIALKSFNAEIVDETGDSVPLQETYLHHWVVVRYYQPKKSSTNNQSDIVIVRNSGICQENVLGQYFGIGAETRGTDTNIPDPFGIEVGNPSEIPKGYEEKWLINVHAIDTRGVQDRVGCIECRCDLYNITRDENGKPLSSDYYGGLQCCPDESHCKLRTGFKGPKRSLYLRYTVKWVTWEHFVVPLKVYILDVTDILKFSNGSKGISPKHDCLVEYQVEACSKSNEYGSECLDVKREKLLMEKGGYVIYGVGHQHVGGTATTLYGQDGRVICTSKAKYGKGNEAGNERGYVVGMTTCYPKPGSVKIMDAETVTLEVNYSNSKMHSGVMGLFYLLVAEKLPPQHM